ncbi:MAG: prepilin-type N-terminal cleavage/methylation domain-containing protein [Gemmatimonadota bacterium]|nr:prepilin-type N-terminal cleavage/methylation domain-containing protein [Gemmatimonadota bacterium]
MRTHLKQGVSLLELMVVILLLGVIGGAIGTTLSKQQWFYRETAERLWSRESVRDAMEVLSADIRGMSVSDTVRLRADSAIEFFANIGSSVVCQIAGNDVGLPSAHSSANSLSAFLTEPDTGDLAVFYAHSESDGERWEQHRIVGFTSRSLASSCPPTSGMSQRSELDAAAGGFVVTIATPLGGGIGAGSPVRFVRRARYSLYRAGDSNWYLGYRRCSPIGGSACGVIQPVSGTYRSYSSDPRASGLLFEYFDATGERLTATGSPLALARVDITARSGTGQSVAAGHLAPRISDSATVSVAIRNTVR